MEGNDVKPLILGRTDRMTPAEFTEMRRNYIGASDAGALTGHNKFENALSIWLQKTGRAEAKEENEAFDLLQLYYGDHENCEARNDNQWNDVAHITQPRRS